MLYKRTNKFKIPQVLHYIKLSSDKHILFDPGKIFLISLEKLPSGIVSTINDNYTLDADETKKFIKELKKLGILKFGAKEKDPLD